VDGGSVDGGVGDGTGREGQGAGRCATTQTRCFGCQSMISLGSHRDMACVWSLDFGGGAHLGGGIEPGKSRTSNLSKVRSACQVLPSG